MSRVKRGIRTRARHHKIIKQAKGYFGKKSKLFKVANQAVLKSGNYAYRDRRQKKRDFRKLWIARISAAVRAEGLSYSQFMHALKISNIELNRKALSNMAIEDKASFSALVATAKKALEA